VFRMRFEVRMQKCVCIVLRAGSDDFVHGLFRSGKSVAEMFLAGSMRL
jgi:hypothetical protein